MELADIKPLLRGRKMTTFLQLTGHTRPLSRALMLAVLAIPLIGLGQINVSSLTAPASTLTISDIDFLNATTPKWLFTINMTNVGGSVDVTMAIRLNIKLASGEQFDDAVVLITKSFTIKSSLTVTNLDLGRGGTIPQSSYVVDSHARHRLEEVALPSGTLPAGNYVFNVIVTPTNGGAEGKDAFQINLSNPSSVELITPFDGDALVNRLPLFQWQYDGKSARISVYEKLPGQVSLEEAASGVPQLVATAETRSYQYPSAGVRELQPGKTYVWMVEGLARTAGGTETVYRSALRSFTIASNNDGSSDAQLLEDLERALGPRFQPLFDQIRAEGLSFSDSFRLNGSVLSKNDLRKIINQLRRNPGAVTSAGLD
jgi:hypothetical protein